MAEQVERKKTATAVNAHVYKIKKVYAINLNWLQCVKKRKTYYRFSLVI